MLQRITSQDQIDCLAEGDVLFRLSEAESTVSDEVEQLPADAMQLGISCIEEIASFLLFELTLLDDFIMGEPIARWTVSETSLISDGLWWIAKSAKPIPIAQYPPGDQPDLKFRLGVNCS